MCYVARRHSTTPSESNSDRLAESGGDLFKFKCGKMRQKIHNHKLKVSESLRKSITKIIIIAAGNTTTSIYATETQGLSD